MWGSLILFKMSLQQRSLLQPRPFQQDIRCFQTRPRTYTFLHVDKHIDIIVCHTDTRAYMHIHMKRSLLLFFCILNKYIYIYNVYACFYMEMWGTMSHLLWAGLDEPDEPDEATPAAKGSLNPWIFFGMLLL